MAVLVQHKPYQPLVRRQQPFVDVGRWEDSTSYRPRGATATVGSPARRSALRVQHFRSAADRKTMETRPLMGFPRRAFARSRRAPSTHGRSAVVAVGSPTTNHDGVDGFDVAVML